MIVRFLRKALEGLDEDPMDLLQGHSIVTSAAVSGLPTDDNTIYVNLMCRLDNVSTVDSHVYSVSVPYCANFCNPPCLTNVQRTVHPS
jgi:hypothetical protein